MQQVEIRVKGRIDQQWSQWFDGIEVSYSGEDETLLSGPVRDQTALYSMLSRLRDLGLPLLSVKTEKLDYKNL
jgi:hypothetical protein